MFTPRQLKRLDDEGENISRLMRREAGSTQNSEHIIEVSYDLQAGSYVASLKDTAMAKHKLDYTIELASRIRSLSHPTSILEAGVGEATTLSGVVKNLGFSHIHSYGFDLSWSRIRHAIQGRDSPSEEVRARGYMGGLTEQDAGRNFHKI